MTAVCREPRLLPVSDDVPESSLFRHFGLLDADCKSELFSSKHVRVWNLTRSNYMYAEMVQAHKLIQS